MSATATHVFRLPDLGEGLTEAALVHWLVQVGDVIVTDQPVAEVETAKSIVELPSPFAGTVAALHGDEGATIDVGAPVLEVVTESHQGPDALAPAELSPSVQPTLGVGTDVAPPLGAGTDVDGDVEAYREEERAGSGNVLIGYGTSHPTSRRRRRTPATPTAPRTTAAEAAAAAARSAAVGTSTGLAPAAAATTRADRLAGPHPTVAVRSPLVRRLARDLGVDPRTVTPTGADGAVTRADVLRAAVDAPADVNVADVNVAAAAVPTAAGREEVEGLRVAAREPLSMLRKAVSAKLTRSRAEIPDATVWVDADLTNLWNLRPSMAAAGAKPPSVTAILARFVLLALEEYPLLAARLSDDGGSLLRYEGVNLGIAADTPRGLMVPVISRADRRSITELDHDLRGLAEGARGGALPPERLRGSTFTLNNYGGFGVDGSAAIINHPEVAILGIGRIMERPWVVAGQIVPRRIAQLSLVFDHRACDGGYAAGFLRHVVDAVEQPLLAYGRI